MVATNSKKASPLPSKPVEVGLVAIYGGNSYYSEPKSGVWQPATKDKIKALKEGDRISIANQNWVYEYAGWDADEDAAIAQFVGYPKFRTRICRSDLQLPGLAFERELAEEDSEDPPEEEVRIPCPPHTLKIMGTRISSMELTKDKVKGIFQHQDKNWVAAGGIGSGTSSGDYSSIWAMAVVPLIQWEKPTCKYSDLPRYSDGTLNRTGQLVQFRKEEWVLTGEQATFYADGPAIALPPTADSDIEPVASSLLDSLIGEISDLCGRLEEAEEVANSAAKSALTFALEIGDRLLAAKRECGHGKWESARSRIISPRSNKPLASSTATLYQRMAERREELEQSDIQTLRAAAEFLKSDRQIKSAAKGHSVADLPDAKGGDAPTPEPAIAPTEPPTFHDSYIEEAEAAIAAYHSPSAQESPPQPNSLTAYREGAVTRMALPTVAPPPTTIPVDLSSEATEDIESLCREHGALKILAIALNQCSEGELVAAYDMACRRRYDLPSTLEGV